jgi:capsular polysaccharide biosynthesis protein
VTIREREAAQGQGETMDGRIEDWQEGPGVVESMRRYRWAVVAITLIAAMAALAWSFAQPVLYQGVVRLYLATSADQADPGRVVRSQAEFITSPEVLDRTLALSGERMSRKELERRLTVEPVTDADVIKITVLDGTPAQAGALAESVARAYRESLATQTTAAARQEQAALVQRQKQIAREIDDIDGQLNEDPGNQRLLIVRQSKQEQLGELADQVESARDSAFRAAARAETVRESATVPEDPAQPQPIRNVALGAMAGLALSAGLAWWLNGRREQRTGRPESAVGETWPEPNGNAPSKGHARAESQP